MIPPRINDDRVSAGERRVFGLLSNDPATTDWTVLHSLGLARRPTGPYGEIDFVVIIPGEGVICLEVKGGRVFCKEGVWRTMDRHGNVATLKKSPFLQARDSMFALRKAMVRHFGKAAAEARCPVGCAVVFPDVPCPPPLRRSSSVQMSSTPMTCGDRYPSPSSVSHAAGFASSSCAMATLCRPLPRQERSGVSCGRISR